MTETETSETPNMKKLKQTISIPFIWEERPGTPKKNWKPSTTTRTTMTTMTVIKPPIETPPPPPPPPPQLIKLIASVPFKWEEKPGKPIPSFSNSMIINTLPQADIISPLSPPRYSEDDDNSISCDDFGNDELDKMWESEIESFESFSSAPSLLANGLVSSFAISRAVPVVDDTTKSGQLKSPGSPVASEAGSSTSSYATGTTSLAGSSFLEWLFPSLITSSAAAAADHATLPGKVGDIQEKNGVVDQANLKVRSEELDRESNSSVVVRRASTLGELIMMSRRRSYHRKALQMMKRNPSMEFMKKNVFGCGIFQGSNGSSGLHQKWKKQFQLKIM